MQSNSAEQFIKVYFDENLPHQFAKALNLIQNHLNKSEKKSIQVLSITEEYGEGVLDVEWIPKVGEVKGIVITQDRNIQHTKHERDLYLEHGCGMIFLKSSKGKLNFWELFKIIVKRWDEIKQIARKNAPPFAYRQLGYDKGFEVWN